MTISTIFLLIIIIYIINGSYQKQNDLTKEIIITKAKALFEAMKYTRKWNSSMGGIYVKDGINPDVKPNPYLKNNYIKSKNNKTLIYINPAFMTRQISDLTKEADFSYKITSLNPINPNNLPTEFEKRALKYLSLNLKEAYYYEFIDNKLNFIGGLKIENSCLECHSEYKIGEIRGGISVNIDISDEIIKMDDIKGSKNLLYIIIITIILILLIRLYMFLNRINADKKKQENILIQQSKMASMGEMIGVIAHQWKQPLNALSLINYDIKDAYEFRDLNEEYMNKSIEKSNFQIEFMSKTIDDFRNFFKPSKEKKTFSAKSAILDILNILNSQFKKSDIEIKIETKENNDKIYGFENEFKQAVLNILNNAKDTILSQKKKKLLDSGVIEILIEKNDLNLNIKFIDNGGGIPDDIIKNLFTPYITTKGNEGTGIGLYISKIIISNISGKIRAYNLKNGACFEITLPFIK